MIKNSYWDVQGLKSRISIKYLQRNLNNLLTYEHTINYLSLLNENKWINKY